MNAARWGLGLGPQISIDCDAASESNEYLGHMIQKCPRRNPSYNNIVKILERELEERGYTTNIEPRVSTIPDLQVR